MNDENESYGFKLHIESCDNAAFGEGDEQERRFEVARILRAVADRIEGGERCDKYRNLMDANGNIVGTFKLAPKREL